MMQTLQAARMKLEGTIRDVMSTDIHTATTTTSIGEVANLMARHNVRQIVVVDERKQVAGVISQREILNRFCSPDGQAGDGAGELSLSAPIETLIGEVDPVGVPPDLPLNKAAVALAQSEVGCLPVLRNGRELVGLLTFSDMLWYITGHAKPSLEGDFQFYSPSRRTAGNRPAYIRSMNGRLVIPLSWLEGQDTHAKFAALGYDAATERIIVKFMDEGRKSDGVLRIKRDKEQLEIPARDFAGYFDLREKTRSSK